MISGIFFITPQGVIILSRIYRQGVNTRLVGEIFRNEVLAKGLADISPFYLHGNLVYFMLKLNEVYLVLTISRKTSCFLSIQFAIRLTQLLSTSFHNLRETTLRKNYVAILEMLDEVNDFGYPILTDEAAINEYISSSGIRGNLIKPPTEAQRITEIVTGNTPWRVESLVYKINEMFVDVVEELNVLIKENGDVLHQSVTGKVIVKNFLSGMPVCLVKFDECENVNNALFHPCVRLKESNWKLGVEFIPPDGDFVLMRYYYHQEISSLTSLSLSESLTSSSLPLSQRSLTPPLSVIAIKIEEIAPTRKEISFVLKINLDSDVVANDIILNIPCPVNTAQVIVKVDRGEAKYSASEHAIVWRIDIVKGYLELNFTAEILQIATTQSNIQKQWSKLPIEIKFKCVPYSFSKLKVAELRVSESTLRYSPNKWIRYIASTGRYECRLAEEMNKQFLKKLLKVIFHNL